MDLRRRRAAADGENLEMRRGLGPFCRSDEVSAAVPGRRAFIGWVVFGCRWFVPSRTSAGTCRRSRSSAGGRTSSHR